MTDFDQPPVSRPVADESAQIPAEETRTIPDRPEGPAAAAVLAAGVGALTLGVVTTVAEMSTGFSDWLAFSDRVGPLSGKTIVTVAVWLLSWIVLHVVLRGRARLSQAVLITGIVLIGLGLLGTFPTFFDLFASD